MLLTHHYVPDRAPAPYAESIVSDKDLDLIDIAVVIVGSEVETSMADVNKHSVLMNCVALNQ